MAVHIRNTLSAKTSWTNNYLWSRSLVTLREVFLAGRWIESYKTNPAEWTNNEALILGDGAVLAVNPRRITSATGGFTGKDGYGITVLASNDQNRGMFKIDRVISDNEVEIEIICSPPDGWVDESGITLRLFNWGNDDLLSTNTILVMRCPTGDMEAFFRNGTSNYYVQVNGYPDRYQLGAGHGLGQIQFAHGSGAACIRWNAHFDGNAALLYFYIDDNDWETWMFGELDDALPGDTYPGYMSVYGDIGGHNDISMLSADDYATPYTLQPALRSRGNTTTHQLDKARTRTVKGKAQLVKPWFYGDGPHGGYFRGRVPHIRWTNADWENWRPMSPDRTWRHLSSGLVVPMNGPNDHPIIRDAATPD